MKELNFNINDILKISLNYEKKCFFADLLNLDLAYFKVNHKVDDPDIIINIGEFKPSNNDCFLVDHKYYIKNNYLYCRDADNIIRWEVEISGFEEGTTTVNFDFNILKSKSYIPCLPIHDFLVQGILFFKLFRKGYFLIHSAAVSKNNSGILLAGRGGAFKTSLAMDFIREKDYKFFGDDMVIINKDHIFPFPTSLVRFNFLLKNLPTEKYRNGLDKLKLLRYIIDNYNDLDKAHIARESSINYLLSITKKKELKDINIKEIPDNRAIIKKLVISNQLEMSLNGSNMPKLTGMTSNHFYRYLLSYTYTFPKSKLAQYFHDMECNLIETFKDIPTYEIEIPKEYDTSIFNRLCDTLDL